METVFKRYFWVLNLIVLAAAAYILASTINDYVGDKVLAVPTASLSVESPGVAASRLVPQHPEAQHMSEDLAARRAFNSDPPPEPEPEIIEPADEQIEEEPEEEEEVIECDELGLSLIGTMMAPEPSMSLATVDADGKSVLVRIGSTVMDTAEVKDIHRRYIRLDNASEECVVKLWEEEKKDDGKTKRGRKPSRHKVKKRVSRRHVKPKNNYKEGVKKTGKDKFQISRSMLDSELEDLSSLGRQARIVPNYRNGKYEGFKLVGVRPSSLYKAIGIRSGDIVKRINGSEINSPNKAIKLFESLKNKSNITLDIERRGHLKSMNYVIK